MSHKDTILSIMKPGEFIRSRHFDDAGIPRVAVRRALEAGVIEQIARGIYCLPDTAPADITQMEAARLGARYPAAVLCYMTALRFHGLTDNHNAPWTIAVRRTSPVAVPDDVRVVRWRSEQAYTVGVETHLIAGTRIQVTSPARTVADAFRPVSGLSEETAQKALAAFLRSGGEPEEIGRIMRTLGADGAAGKLVSFARTLISEGLLATEAEEAFVF